jgi:hypothetical protein
VGAGTEGDEIVVQVPPTGIELSPPPRPDGYRELALALQMWAGVSGYKGDRKAFWYVLGAARRLDTAHRQFERVRLELDAPPPPDRPQGPPPEAERVFEILGDAQLAVIALHRAAAMAERLESCLGVTLGVRFPRSVARRMPGIRELRHAQEHVDDRALGLIAKGSPDLRKAHRAFSILGDDLVRTRRIRYRRWSLDVDGPTTSLFQALRGYLLSAWVELCDKDRQRRHRM